MTTVRQLLDQKGRKIWSIPPDATVFAAIANRPDQAVMAIFKVALSQFLRNRFGMPFAALFAPNPASRATSNTTLLLTRCI
jgi:hypothetical protein